MRLRVGMVGVCWGCGDFDQPEIQGVSILDAPGTVDD